MHANLVLILIVIFTTVLFLSPFVYLWLVCGPVPSLADFITEYENVGIPPARILSVGLSEGFKFFVAGLFVVALLFIGASLVFDVSWQKKQIWGRKSPLHIYFGYYVMIVLLFSMFVDDILGRGWHPRLWGTANAPTLLFLLFLLSFSILLARVTSKLPIKIGGEANLGYFIISVYLSYAFFKIMGQGFNLFVFWNHMLNVRDWRGVMELVPIYANTFFILALPAIFALGIMILDRITNKYLQKIY